MVTPAQEPCAEFMKRRLERAKAIPAAERPPSVAAFVESVQLLREACDMLPLTAEGSPALPIDDLAARQQMLLAFLKAARAYYVCPAPPVSDKPHDVHLAAYTSRWLRLAERGARSSGVEAVLLLVAAVRTATMLDRVDLARRAAALLADDSQRSAVGRQLGYLAAVARQAQPQLSLGQLHYLCLWSAANAANQLFMGLQMREQAAQRGMALPAALDMGGIPPVHLDALRTAGRSFTAQLLQLEPRNPRGYWEAASSAGCDQQRAEAINLGLQGFRLAQEQHDDWSAAKSAQLAVMNAAAGIRRAPLSIGRSALEAVAAACQQAQQAHHRCKQLLPQLWVDEVRPEVVEIGVAAQQASLQGQHLQQYSHADALEVLRSQLGDVLCDGCGRRSVGLRRCSRCKKAQYCSTECQHQHWRVHKRECRPA